MIQKGQEEAVDRIARQMGMSFVSRVAETSLLLVVYSHLSKEQKNKIRKEYMLLTRELRDFMKSNGIEIQTFDNIAELNPKKREVMRMLVFHWKEHANPLYLDHISFDPVCPFCQADKKAAISVPRT